MTSRSHLRPDGTTFPPVTPDPPFPPGYEEPDILEPGAGSTAPEAAPDDRASESQQAEVPGET